MTGPEHYQAAEKAATRAMEPNMDLPRAAIFAQLATAHATLASAAATALAAITAQCGDSRGSFYLASGADRQEWEKAATLATTLG